MAKKIRRSLHNAGSSTVNFGKWLPKATEHFFEEVPTAAHRLGSWVRTFRGLLTILCLIGVLVFPILVNNEFLYGLFVLADVWVIFAASWDLLAGFVGLVSFGQAAFFGIGGYLGGAMLRYYNQPWWMAVLVGALVAVLFGLLVGIPCLKLRGPYLTLGTLAFSLILLDLFQSTLMKPWLNGSEGVSQIRPMSYDAATGTFSPVVDYLIVLGLMVLSVVVLISITRSRVGTLFKSIRDDEISAEAAGINTTKYKLLAFMISAFFAGIGGSLFSLTQRSASPPMFSTLFSFYPIIIAALGGVGTIFGALGGSYFFTFISLWLLSGLTEISLLIFGVLLILVFRFASGGFVNPLIDRLKEFIQVLRGK